MASVDSLEKLLQEELKDLYDAERQLTKAIPKLVKKATAEELKRGLQEHLRQTGQQIERLERVFEHLGMPARGRKCIGIQHLLEEGEAMIGEAEEDATRDAVIIAAAQKIEHYEIASYGTVRTWARELGNGDVAMLLEETLDEEKDADQKLTEIAESIVNGLAATEGQSEEDEEEGTRAAMVRGRAGTSARSSRQTAADRKRR